MLQKVEGGNGSFGRDVMFRHCKGKGVVSQRRDLTDSRRGKVVVRERRDVTDSARGKGSLGRDM